MNLRDYQLKISQAATAILRRYRLVYLAMQVRTGKTHTSLYTAMQLCPKNVLFLTKNGARNPKPTPSCS